MKQRPNILLLFTDEQKLSELSAYGPTPCSTPRLVVPDFCACDACR